MNHAPIGFRWTLAPHEKEQRAIARVIQLHWNELSLRQICRQLEKERFLCRGNKKWHPQTVSNILDRAGET